MARFDPPEEWQIIDFLRALQPGNVIPQVLQDVDKTKLQVSRVQVGPPDRDWALVGLAVFVHHLD